MKIVFATNNSNKLKELKSLLPENIELLSLRDIDCVEELPETGATLEANSLQKAQYIYDKYGMNCIADDTGLEVAALQGRPGVYSARYAGSDGNASENIKKLLVELQGTTDRRARFRTVITFIRDSEIFSFEGRVEGHITFVPSGNNGFGYDPVFIPLGDQKTFAEMTLDEKNRNSHRAKAFSALLAFLNQTL